MEIQLSSVRGEESDGVNSLIAARVKISGMLHKVAAGSGVPAMGYEAGMSKGGSSLESEKSFMASSTINWTGGDTDFQVRS